jgi:hypothetical protein
MQTTLSFCDSNALVADLPPCIEGIESQQIETKQRMPRILRSTTTTTTRSTREVLYCSVLVAPRSLVAPIPASWFVFI